MTPRSASRYRKAAVAALFGFALLVLAAAGPAEGQAIIKVSDTVNIKFGLLLQPMAEWAETSNTAGTETTGYGQAFFLRRARFLMGGQLGKEIFFFMETENANLGRKTSGTTNLGTGFQLLDAVAEWRIAKGFNLMGGLLRVPFSRESLKAAGSTYEIDVQTFNYVQGPSLGWTGGNRDTGFQIRGYALDDRFEYRVTATQGARLTTQSKNSFAWTGRVQYNFFDTELYNMPSYPGSYIDGKKKIFAVGAAYQRQGAFKYASADVFASIPVSSGVVEGTFQYQYLDGSTMFPLLAHQNIYMIEAGYYAKGLTLGPWARYEQINYNGTSNLTTSKNEQRVWAGLGWWVFGYTFNVKAAYERIMPKTAVDRNLFVMQLSFYYF